jgi:Zn-dependent peptidase ImmA (M78 family)
LSSLQPADPFANARSLGIVLVRKALAERAIAGAYLYLPEHDRSFILVNATDVLTRQRFTASHEIGHWMFDQRVTIVDDLIRADEAVEKRANAFASEYLLPEKAVLEWRPRRPWGEGVDDVAELAAQYGLSYEATLWKLKNCGMLESILNLKSRVNEMSAELKSKLGLRLEERLELPVEFLEMLDAALATSLISRKRFEELRGGSEPEVAY